MQHLHYPMPNLFGRLLLHPSLQAITKETPKRAQKYTSGLLAEVINGKSRVLYSISRALQFALI
jgi:hypothetical protein